ncbi:hypothetical protein GM415_11205 [Pseudodesulfovibrio cashew]|uniref:Uncharacterized protein n=1 Tax=Pseudodesulfovibrio cashew TaxID=2678688 RepID=A0A6I6JCY0_9BACT|nr:hypothetical protein [Pseudodesulfovibrio cashew]QGY40666.1 hypothetical protein GM415_11205 [Pseudodesulfovibrio cashew]
MSQLTLLLEKMGELEEELTRELARKQEKWRFTIERKKVRFSEEVRARHRELLSKFSDYVYDSGFFIVLTVPVIWAALVPVLFLDAVVCVYQLVCFPVYGIPRVKRSDYVVMDRHSLQYLNWLEKLNCAYCGYFNGLMSFVREVAARTEQYWCPVRHARPVKSVHSRYKTFFDYGDAQGYRDGLARVRREYDDVR